MKPADPQELREAALIDAKRLAERLCQMAPDALGIGGSGTTYYYVRDAHIANIARVVVDLEEMKEGTS